MYDVAFPSVSDQKSKQTDGWWNKSSRIDLTSLVNFTQIKIDKGSDPSGRFILESADTDPISNLLQKSLAYYYMGTSGNPWNIHGDMREHFLGEDSCRKIRLLYGGWKKCGRQVKIVSNNLTGRGVGGGALIR